MDGRVNLPVITQTPLGIMSSWRNIGGTFDLFQWPRFQNSVEKLWRCAKANDRPLLWIVTDHFSRSNNRHLGCAGYDCNIEKAQEASRALKRQFDHDFGGDLNVFTIHVTIETDEGALIFHAPHSEDLDLGLVHTEISRDILFSRLKAMYQRKESKTSDQMLHDVLRLAMKNVAHVSKVRTEKRSITEVEHREWVLVVGQADWLEEMNMALTVGPYDPQFVHWVKVATKKILIGNTKRKDFNRHRGVVLMASAQFTPDEGDVGRRLAEHKATYLADQSARAIEFALPDLKDYLQYLTVTVNMDTRGINIMEAR